MEKDICDLKIIPQKENGLAEIQIHLETSTWREHGEILKILTEAIPNYFMIHGVWARHGYSETLFLGTLILALSCQSLDKGISPKSLFLMGLAAGLGWWTNFLILYYFIPWIFFLFLKFFQNRGLKEKIKIIGFSTFGYFLGSLPFWCYNFKNFMWSYAMFGGEPSSNLLTRLIFTFQNSFPVLLGTKQYVTGVHVPYLSHCFFYIFCIGFIFFFLYEAIFFFKNLKNRTLTPSNLIWLFGGSLILIFFKSKFSELSTPNIRYLLPFYTLYPIVLVYFFKTLHDRFHFKPLTLILVVGAGVINLTSIWFGSPFFQKNQRENYQSEIKHEEDLFQVMRQEEKKHFLMRDYWKAARFTFDCKEEFIFAHLESRYLPYLFQILGSQDVHYLMNSKDTLLENGLKTLGFDFSLKNLLSYTLYTPLPQNPKIHKKVISSSSISFPYLEDQNFDSFIFLNMEAEEPRKLRFQFESETPLSGMAFLLRKRRSHEFDLKVTDQESGKIIFENQAPFIMGRVAGNWPYLRVKSNYFEVFWKPALVKKFEVQLISKKYPFFGLREIFFFHPTPK